MQISVKGNSEPLSNFTQFIILIQYSIRASSEIKLYS